MNTADSRRDLDYRVEGRVTAIAGAGEDVVATVRIEAQRGVRKVAASEDISARFVRARPTRAMKERGDEIHQGDFAVVLVPVEPSKRVVAMIHRRRTWR